MRRLAKILFAIFTVLLLIAVGFYLYLVPFGGMESILNRKLDSLLQGKYQLDITVGEIKGDILNNLMLEDVTVYYGDSLTGYRMLQLPRLSTAYSLSNIWNKRYLFDYIHIDSAILTLQSDSAGQWQLPNFKGEKKDQPTQSVSFPGFEVNELVINNLDVTIIRPEDTISVDDLVLTLAVQSEDKTYSAHIKRFEFSSNQQRLVLGSAGGKVTYSEGSLVMKDIALVSEETRIKVDGMANLHKPVEGYIDFAVDHLDLADVAAWVGPKLKGVVDLNGRVQLANDVLDGSVDIGGDFMIASFENLFVDFRFADKTLYLDTLIGTILDNCAVDGYGMIDFSGPTETYELTANIRQFNLKKLITNSFYSNLNGHLFLQGESFRKNDMLLNFDVEVFESVFDEYPLQKAEGRMAITTKSIEFMEPFQVSYFENVFNAHGLVEYTGDMNIEVTADLKNLDRYQYCDKLFIEQPGGRGYAEAVVSGKTNDPDLAGIFVSDSVWLYGLYCDSLYSTVDIKRFLTGKQGTVEVDFYRGAAWDLPYDTGYSFVRVDSNLVHIDTAVMWSEYTLEGGRGVFDYGVEPMMLTIDTIWLDLFDQPFNNLGRIDVAIDSLGFDFQKAAIGNNGAMLSLLGRVDYDETMDLLLAVQKIPIEPWKNLFVDTLDVAGYLSCEARVRGSFWQPEFTLMAEV
ncbi:MAG: hypothetical protein KAU36_01665, partial [candidate division Zixibacteria bacterium]|nr:hypothetical protein [candidate division Zixibacteria bacterium]